jgi:hypothetical protein
VGGWVGEREGRARINVRVGVKVRVRGLARVTGFVLGGGRTS